MDKSKYQSVIDLSERLNINDSNVKVENGQLKFRVFAKSESDKNQLLDEIKRVGGENPSDIMVDIKVDNDSNKTHHTVKSGETLGKIAKQYYGDSSKYNVIYEANKDKLKSADLIHPGDELVIPSI